MLIDANFMIKFSFDSKWFGR